MIDLNPYLAVPGQCLEFFGFEPAQWKLHELHRADTFGSYLERIEGALLPLLTDPNLTMGVQTNQFAQLDIALRVARPSVAWVRERWTKIRPGLELDSVWLSLSASASENSRCTSKKESRRRALRKL
jgi:hypothetical protein